MGGGTTILSAIRQSVSRETQISYSPDGNKLTHPDAVLVVVGERPYAEMKGDRADLSLSTDDAALVEKAKQSGAPVVTLLLSGRPLVLGPTLETSDAFVAAWLPGTEGEGVADVLFGACKPKGKLPRTWPRSNDQAGLTCVDSSSNRAQFAYGFGLTY